jgi:hypothetical protein
MPSARLTMFAAPDPAIRISSMLIGPLYSRGATESAVVSTLQLFSRCVFMGQEINGQNGATDTRNIV